MVTSEVGGRAAQTFVSLVRETPCAVQGALSTVDLWPVTGRRHQLRLHCSRDLGCPILGDDLYATVEEDGDNDAAKDEADDDDDDDIDGKHRSSSHSRSTARRRGGLFLQAVELRFRHPFIAASADADDPNVVAVSIPERPKFEAVRVRAASGAAWAEANS